MTSSVIGQNAPVKERLLSKLIKGNREVALDLLVNRRDAGKQNIVGYAIVTTGKDHQPGYDSVLQSSEVASCEYFQSFVLAYTRFNSCK